ncbi:transcriptional regulator, TetR family [Marinactinospora thermotolerans DSM 45154]|uniref:Transcriptional regulator, TetR family n=1 Tax=Marinactinospora thermotolerans DSM 45154 TaxID=1122192 RepID=A0A1T4KIA2_9ACTN|nr:transcriptional regulator, TetR family [Marinactinospora thermotolerans DSM 45154]
MIFEAVASVVTEEGPAGATLATVAARVGLSGPALTQRFGSKRGLLVAFAAKAASRVPEVFSQVRAVHADPVTAVVEALVTMPGRVTSREHLANNLALLQMDLTDPDLREHAVFQSRSLRAETAALLDEAVRAGRLAEGTSPEALAMDLYTTYSGAMLTWAIDGEGTLEEWMRSNLLRTLAPHLRGSGGADSR